MLLPPAPERYTCLLSQQHSLLHVIEYGLPLPFSIQTAGLAFGGTGLCSYRVRGVGGSCAEHLTVESYTIIISLQSYFSLLVFHHPLSFYTLGLNPSFSANPPYRSPSFVSFKIHYMDFPDCLLLLLSISVFLLFSFFSVFTLFLVSVPCGRLSWLMSAFERTLK